MTTHESRMDSTPAQQQVDQTPAGEQRREQPVTAEPDTPTAMTLGTQPGHETSTDGALFGEDELSGLRAHWNDLQARFVDDPKDCVHQADGLVSEVVDKLTAGFTDTRSRLEAHWARGDQASTEDLRLALQRYREFFERLLAV